MSRYWSPIVHTLTPYVPGEQPKINNLIKLNTNENPYGPSPKVLAAIQDANKDALRLYPDPNSDALKATIARYHGVKHEQVFVGNGSDEVLAHAFCALLKQQKPLYFPDISYSFYPVYCDLYGITAVTPALTESFEIDLADYDDAGAIIFPNPNAPTGRLLALEAIDALLKRVPDVPVVVDEAYIDFGGDSAVALVERHRNLLVVCTLSKSRSLAGLRVGYAIGDAALIEGLERVKNSFNSYPLDRLAQAGAIASFEDEAYFQETRAKVIASREWLIEDMQELGFEILPSTANFVFARHPQHAADLLAARLRERAILVRHFKAPRIDQFLRISIGTDPECEALVKALADIIGP
ncbi:histidinol-phosphate transaminase [Chitinolyticbacter albus]|uniref:histidinol-phosphate transaminase n=1 Tax=Chitinolyticbacter albus TaxID=2961951 RepID=UPI0021091FAE|nr:histidinol-phosphate transaminase [Chitinolyticbacter albus]